MASKLKSAVEIIEKIEELIRPAARNYTSQDEILIIAIEELRRRYDKISHDYDTTRIKLITLLGGGLAFLSFMYSGKTPQGKADIFFPPALADRIFYFIGLGLVLVAMGVLFWAILPRDWSLPLDAKRLNNLDDHYTSKNKFLLYVKNEYLESLAFCMRQLAKLVRMLNASLVMLFIGAIILLVLKYFGG